MPKTIEESFMHIVSKKDSRKVHVHARNYNSHYFAFEGKDIYLTTDEMRGIANFLNECADKIDSDPDFKTSKP